mmetsp:Transcript_57953/g.155208  ORF Transcript_57953/g.155208 Transcript_57953/m.155208 type:complete len:151 (+) Transcript_57953:26-478(+)
MVGLQSSPSLKILPPACGGDSLSAWPLEGAGLVALSLMPVKRRSPGGVPGDMASMSSKVELCLLAVRSWAGVLNSSENVDQLCVRPPLRSSCNESVLSSELLRRGEPVLLRKMLLVLGVEFPREMNPEMAASGVAEANVEKLFSRNIASA